MILLAVTFSPDTSPYQRFKIELLSIVHLSKDAVHVYIGVGCLLASLLLLRGRVRWKALLPGLAVSLAMEAVDLSDEWRVGRGLKWRASVHDVLNTNAIPVVLVFVLRRKWVRPG
jgi:hypothetical protein